MHQLAPLNIKLPNSLHTVRQGLTTDTHALVSQVCAVHLERLMLRFPNMFRQELSGVGATLEKRWKFCGFDRVGSA